MESKANFALVGIFVVVFTTVFIAAILWIVGIKTSKEYDCYKVQTKRSISGLHKDSSVRYKGVNVGKVFDIKINKSNPEFIDIYIKVEKDLPVKTDTKAKISSNGLTGIAYINLTSGSKNTPLLKKESKEECPTIQTIPTTLERLSVSASEIMSNLNKILSKIDSSLDNKSMQYLHKTIKNSYEATKNIKKITKNLQQTTLKFNKLLENGNQLTKKLIIDSDNLNKLIKSINSSNIKNFTSNGLENLNTTVNELNRTLQQIRNLTLELKHNPSLILKGKKIEKGPGE